MINDQKITNEMISLRILLFRQKHFYTEHDLPGCLLDIGVSAARTSASYHITDRDSTAAYHIAGGKLQLPSNYNERQGLDNKAAD